MKIYVHKYFLNPVANLNSLDTGAIREGALLKIQWIDGAIGYSDLHPWPTLGDEPLDKHLKDLKSGKISTLVEQSIWLARRDAKLRQKGLSAFTGATKVKNHGLLVDYKLATDKVLGEFKSLGFKTLKVKLGRNVTEEGKWVDKLLKQNSFLLRLDFNASIDYVRFEEFIRQVDTSVRPRIEFVEDPTPYDFAEWKEIEKYVTIAIDGEHKKPDYRSPYPMPFKVGVIKPARQDVKDMTQKFVQKNLKIVVTSSLDHPVGIAHAGYVAQELKKDYPALHLDCGILSHRQYQFNHYTSMLDTQGPFFLGVKGSGIGFDPLFASEKWTPISDV